MDCEIKVCSSCGKTLPVEQFTHWVNKDGSTHYLHQCLKCQRDKANKRFSDKKKFGELARFNDEDIITEVKRRNIYALEHIPSYDLIQELKSRRQS